VRGFRHSRFRINDNTKTRIDLNLAYTKDFYGAKIGLRTDSFGTPSVYNGYVWSNFVNDIVGVKLGLIDDSVWATEGDEEFHYSTGGGLRIEAKPIEGLNVGVLLTLPGIHNAIPAAAYDETKYGRLWKVDPSGPNLDWDNDDDNRPQFDLGDVGDLFESRFKYFLPETALGAKYESALFNAAAGLKFDSNGDGLDESDPLDVSPTGGPRKDALRSGLFLRKVARGKGFDSTGVSLGPLGLPEGGSFVEAKDGASTYFGVSVKAIDKLTAAVELQWFNAFAPYATAGYIWLDEVLSYDLGKLDVGATLTQFFYGKRILHVKDTYSGLGGDIEPDTVHPYLKFAPWVSYQVFDPLTAKLEVGYATQKNIINYDIWLKPSVTYKLGDNAKIVAAYKYDLEKDSNVGYGIPGQPLSAEHIWTHTVQVNLDWSF
jgi:hypothetical protein